MIAQRAHADTEIAAAKQVAELSNTIQRQHQYGANIRQASAAALRGDRREVLALLEESRRLAQVSVRCGIEWDVLWSQAHDMDIRVQAHQGNVHTVRFSPVDDRLISAGEDGRVVLWNTNDWTKDAEWDGGVGEVNAAEPSADGSLIALGGDGGRLVVQRRDDRSVVFDAHILEGRIYAIEWLAGEQKLAVAGKGSVLTVVDLVTARLHRSEPIITPDVPELQPARPIAGISGLAYVEGQRAVAVAATPACFYLVDATTLEVIRSWSEKIGSDTIGASTTGLLAVASRFDADPSLGDVARLIDARDGAELARAVIPHQVRSLRFFDDDRVLAGAFRNGSIATWELSGVLANRNPSGHRFLAHSGRAVTVDASPDGRLLASGGWDGHISVWRDRLWGEPFDQLLAACPATTTFSPCGRWFAIAYSPNSQTSVDWTFEVFDSQSGELLWERQVAYARYGSKPLVFSPSGNEVLLACHDDETLCVHDPRTGEIVSTLHFPAEGGLYRPTWTPDGRYLLLRPASAGIPNDAYKCMLLDCVSTSVIQHPEPIRGDHFGLYRTILGDVWIEMSDKREVMIRQTPQSAAILTLTGPSENPTTIALSRDGRLLAVGTEEGNVYSWDLLEPSRLRKFIGHEARVFQVCISSDNQTLLTTSVDGTLRFWSTQTGQQLLQLGTSQARVVNAALRPDGQLLVLTIESLGRFGFQVLRLGKDRDSLPRMFLPRVGGES